MTTGILAIGGKVSVFDSIVKWGSRCVISRRWRHIITFSFWYSFTRALCALHAYAAVNVRIAIASAVLRRTSVAAPLPPTAEQAPAARQKITCRVATRKDIRLAKLVGRVDVYGHLQRPVD